MLCCCVAVVALLAVGSLPCRPMTSAMVTTRKESTMVNETRQSPSGNTVSCRSCRITEQDHVKYCSKSPEVPSVLDIKTQQTARSLVSQKDLYVIKNQEALREITTEADQRALLCLATNTKRSSTALTASKNSAVISPLKSTCWLVLEQQYCPT